jgi:aromatic-L-amino-acid decarboxylase
VRIEGPADPLLRLPDRDLLLDQGAAIVREAWRSFDRFRPGQPAIDATLAGLLATGLPDEPTDVAQCLAVAAEVLDQSLAQPRPRFFAYIGGAGLEVGVLADFLAACFDVNLASWAGAASEIESQTARWLGEFLGYPAGGGFFTSGGTLSNLSALLAARESALPGARSRGLEGRRVAAYCSVEAHYSVVRAVEAMGMGADWLRTIPIDRERRMDPEALADAVRADRRSGIVPLAVVATAGTTLTGAVDPLDAIAEVSAEHDLWLHVDGAYGLPAAAVEETAPLFRGLDRADSVSVDAHKWLYMPKACGVLLVRRLERLHQAFGHEEAYFPHASERLHAADAGLEYSRPFRALKLWLAFRVHGAAALRAAIARNLDHGRLCYDLACAADDLEPLPWPPQLSIVPFRHVVTAPEAELDERNREILRRLQAGGDVWLSSATIDGRVYLRPCFVNYRTTDDDVAALVDLVRETARTLGSHR